MQLTTLERKLIAAARAHPTSDAVPFAFARRIMAHLEAAANVDPWSLWARALWRAAAPCVAVALLLGAWAALTPTPSASASSTDLSQDFDRTVLAALDPAESTW
jgi:hypothetical protein